MLNKTLKYTCRIMFLISLVIWIQNTYALPPQVQEIISNLQTILTIESLDHHIKQFCMRAPFHRQAYITRTMTNSLLSKYYRELRDEKKITNLPETLLTSSSLDDLRVTALQKIASFLETDHERISDWLRDNFEKFERRLQPFSYANFVDCIRKQSKRYQLVKLLYCIDRHKKAPAQRSSRKRTREQTSASSTVSKSTLEDTPRHKRQRALPPIISEKSLVRVTKSLLGGEDIIKITTQKGDGLDFSSTEFFLPEQLKNKCFITIIGADTIKLEGSNLIYQLVRETIEHDWRVGRVLKKSPSRK